MAKEKIRKLLREREAYQKQINNMAGMLALLTNRFGGQVSFDRNELKSIPDASFQILLDKDVYTLKLNYDEEAMAKRAEELAQEQSA